MSGTDSILTNPPQRKLFESLLIYLASWCDDWKFSDLYGEEGGTGLIIREKSGGKNLYAITRDRIDQLLEKEIPITREVVETGRQKVSSLVELDQDQVINDFISEINLSSPELKDSFQRIIANAMPLIRIHVFHYYQNQVFANDNLKAIIETFIVFWGDCPSCVKYFPLWFSFLPAIRSPKGYDKGFVQKWNKSLKLSYNVNLPSKVFGFFVNQIPEALELVEKLFDNPVLLSMPNIQSSFDVNLSSFRDGFYYRKGNSYLPFIDNKFNDFILLSHIKNEIITEKFPMLLEYWRNNQEEFLLRTGIVNKMVLSLMLPFFLNEIKHIDYEKEIQAVVSIPLIDQETPLKITLNAPLKDVFEIVAKNQKLTKEPLSPNSEKQN